MRACVYVPIIHTEIDMGSLAGPLKSEYIQKFGRAKWQAHVKAIGDLWDGIRRKINVLKLDPTKTRLYQDGLPICGRELEIVREVARLGSKNYQIVWELIARGAKLEGTENPQYLVEEYQFVKDLTLINDPAQKMEAIQRAKRRRDELLEQRDKFIAERIDRTLQEGETAILFCGIEHRIDKQMPKDIKISFLIYRLPFKNSLGAHAGK